MRHHLTIIRFVARLVCDTHGDGNAVRNGVIIAGGTAVAAYEVTQSSEQAEAAAGTTAATQDAVQSKEANAVGAQNSKVQTSQGPFNGGSK